MRDDVTYATSCFIGRNFAKSVWVSFALPMEVCFVSLLWRHNGHDSVSNQPHDYLLSRLFRPRSKKTSKLRVTGLCAGNSPGTGEFPAQMASNTENVSIWWRHHVKRVNVNTYIHSLWKWLKAFCLSLNVRKSQYVTNHVSPFPHYWQGVNLPIGWSPHIVTMKLFPHKHHQLTRGTGVHFIMKDNQFLAKPPLNFIGSLAKLGFT